MLLFCVFILICCTVLHFYNHFTFQRTKNGLFKISAKNEHHGPYPVVFIVYCVLQIFYNIHLIIYFTNIAIHTNIQSVNIVHFLLYPFSLLHANAISASITTQNILYSNINNLLHLNCTHFTSQIDPFLIINLICFVILFLFEGFFNFYRFYGVYNVSKFLISATLTQTIKKYAIYCFIFVVLSILNVVFNNIFLVFVIICVHMSFNIYCEYKQISILLNQHVTDTIDNILNPNGFSDILQPLYVCRRFCLIATIFSSIYLLGIYGFTHDILYFLLFYPIFFSIITALHTMGFIRNRSFVKQKILCCCCNRNVKQPRNTFNANNATQRIANMTPIGEEMEAQTKDIDIEIMHQQISGGQGGPNESAESGEISGLLTAKNIGSPHSISISVDDDDALIDFTDIIFPPSKATKYVSSPSAPARQSSANNRIEPYTKLNINIGKLRSVQVQSSKSNEDKCGEYKYKLQSDDLLLTLTMLVNSGLVKHENAMHLKSVRKKNRRKQNMQKENELDKVGQDERIFLVTDINMNEDENK